LACASTKASIVSAPWLVWLLDPSGEPLMVKKLAGSRCPVVDFVRPDGPAAG
jgi:hypothetical protein